eukprot:TRINITY_DN13113_c0_g1_i1.p1 TRINITY_DN13113_c0_g1~~TRINITY_DN13113_c0_g1_i1.p1  ORF type:complete len:466 (+),score=131.21 TRINITY_DN13113_c0_g1_i1:654-2051(+)
MHRSCVFVAWHAPTTQAAMLNQLVSIIEKVDPEEAAAGQVSSERACSTGGPSPGSYAAPSPTLRSESRGDVCIDLGDGPSAYRSKSGGSAITRDGCKTPSSAVYRDDDTPHDTQTQDGAYTPRSRRDVYDDSSLRRTQAPGSRTASAPPDESLDFGTYEEAPLEDLSEEALRRLVRLKSDQECTTAQQYREKVAELHDVLEHYTAFRKHAVHCLTEAVACLQAERPQQDAVDLAASLERDIPSAAKSSQEVESWYRVLRQEAVTEAAGGRSLQVAMMHMQETIRQLESELQEKSKHAPTAAAVTSAVSPSSGPTAAPPASGALEEEVTKLRRKLSKATSDLGAKQATLSVLYDEKENLRVLLDVAKAKIVNMEAAPQQQLDDSKLFKSLSHKGRWGARLVTAASRVDFFTMRFGRIMYTNATIRVGIALYFILLHVWVFYVVTSYVHLLPHTSHSIHDHQKLFDN